MAAASASFVVTVIEVASSTDDGVRTLVIVNTCGVAAAMAAEPDASVTVSVRVPSTQFGVSTDRPLLGVVNCTAGAAKAQPACVELPTLGITSTTLPPAGTSPAVVKDTVAVCCTPGVEPATENVLAPPSAAAEVSISLHASTEIASTVLRAWPGLVDSMAFCAIRRSANSSAAQRRRAARTGVGVWSIRNLVALFR